MTPARIHTSARGFTLIEAIIYVGLFGLLFAGILTAVFPLVTGSERLSGEIAVDGEVAFILHKIDYAISQGITDGTRTISSPAQNDNVYGTDDLTIRDGGTDHFHFAYNAGEKTLEYSDEAAGITDMPLNAERVEITRFNAKHWGPQNGAPRYVQIEFDVRRKGETASETVGPVRYYLHF